MKQNFQLTSELVPLRHKVPEIEGSVPLGVEVPHLSLIAESGRGGKKRDGFKKKSDTCFPQGTYRNGKMILSSMTLNFSLNISFLLQACAE